MEQEPSRWAVYAASQRAKNPEYDVRVGSAFPAAAGPHPRPDATPTRARPRVHTLSEPVGRASLALLRTALVALLWTAAPVTTQAQSPPPCTEARPSAPLDLNAATESELQQLPGVGPARARAIVALRNRKGRFRRVSQLLRVRGIGRATLRRLRPLLVVGPPPKRGGPAEDGVP